MTSFSVPLPPDDLAMVWDKDGDRWSRLRTDPANSSYRGPGSWWSHSMGRVLHWSDLIADYAPLSSEKLRCQAYLAFSSKNTDWAERDWDMVRCARVPGHADGHSVDVSSLRWDESGSA